MSVTFEVYPEGTEVTLKGDIEATITAICLRGGQVQYECTWFKGRERVKDWLPDYLIQRGNRPKQIGFRLRKDG